MDVELGDGYRIRQATADDHPALYDICLKTGDSGVDATHLHSDPKLLGYMYAIPYQILAPNFAFVLEGDKGVRGYVLGALDSASFYDRMEQEWLKPLRNEVPKPGPIPALWSRDDSIRARIHDPNFELFASLEGYPSHGHIDILPDVQGKGFGGKLLRHMMTALAEAGSPGIHLGVSSTNVSAQGFYRKLGYERIQAKDIPRQSYIMARRLPL